MRNEILEPETEARNAFRGFGKPLSRPVAKAKPAKLPKHLGPRVYERNAILFTLKHARAC